MRALDPDLCKKIEDEYYRTSKRGAAANDSTHATLRRLVSGRKWLCKFFKANMKVVARVLFTEECRYTTPTEVRRNTFEQSVSHMNKDASAGHPYYSTKELALIRDYWRIEFQTHCIVNGKPPGDLYGWVSKKVEVLKTSKRPGWRESDGGAWYDGGKERNIIVEPLAVVLAFNMLVGDAMDYAMANWLHTTTKVGAGKLDLPAILQFIKREGYSYVSYDISGMEMNLAEEWYHVPAVLRAAQSGQPVEYWVDFYRDFVTRMRVVCECGNVHQFQGGNRSGFPDTIGSNSEITKAFVLMLTYAVAHGIKPDSEEAVDAPRWRAWLHEIPMAVVGDDAIAGLPSEHSRILVAAAERSAEFSTLILKAETMPGGLTDQVFLSCKYHPVQHRVITVRPEKLLASLYYAEGSETILAQALASVYLDLADTQYRPFLEKLIDRVQRRGWQMGFPVNKAIADLVNTPEFRITPQCAVLKSKQEPHKRTAESMPIRKKYGKPKKTGPKKTAKKLAKLERRVAKKMQRTPLRRKGAGPRAKLPNLSARQRTSKGGVSVPIGTGGQFLSSGAMPQAYITEGKMQRMNGFNDKHKSGANIRFCVPMCRYGNSGSSSGSMPGNAVGSGAMAMVGGTTASFTQGFVLGAPGAVGNADTSFTGITGINEMGMLSTALNDLAALYQRYRYRKLRFHFVPSTATTSSARAYWAAWISDPATITRCAAGSATISNAFTYANIYSLPNVKLFPAWQATTIEGDVDGEWKYVQQLWAGNDAQTSSLVASVNYWRTMYTGVLAMFCDYANASASPLLDGMVWVEGVCDLVDTGADFFTELAPSLKVRACDIDQHPNVIKRLEVELGQLGYNWQDVAVAALEESKGDARQAVVQIIDFVRTATGQRRSVGSPLDAKRMFDSLTNFQWNASGPANVRQRAMRVPMDQAHAWHIVPAINPYSEAVSGFNVVRPCVPAPTTYWTNGATPAEDMLQQVAVKSARPDIQQHLIQYSEQFRAGTLHPQKLVYGEPPSTTDGPDGLTVAEENRHLVDESTRAQGPMEWANRHRRYGHTGTTTLTTGYAYDSLSVGQNPNVPFTYQGTGRTPAQPCAVNDFEYVTLDANYPSWFKRFFVSRQPSADDEKSFKPETTAREAPEGADPAMASQHESEEIVDGVFTDDGTTLPAHRVVHEPDSGSAGHAANLAQRERGPAAKAKTKSVLGKGAE